MKHLISIILVSFLCISSAFGVMKKVPKGEKMMYRFEPAPLLHGGHQGSTPIVMLL